MRSALALMTAVAALAVAGCGGSATPAAQSAPSAGASGPASSTPATSAATTSAGAPPTTSTASASAPTGPPLCRAADLTGSFLGGQAAAGHGLLGFALRNTSGHNCTTLGYPGIQFLGQSGQALPTSPAHTTNDFFGSLTDHPLAVPPGTSASFRLGVTHGAASTAGCATAYAVQVIPPNDTATLRISIPNGAYECRTATVSPMQRGNSAYP